MNFVQKLLMALGCGSLLWLGSCTLLGIGGAVAIQQATSPENIERVADEADERENARHNEEMNEEAAWGIDRERPESE